MRKAEYYLPSPFWWLFVALPWVNWAPLLYIGIKTTNPLHVACAAAYVVLLVTTKGLVVPLWLYGVIHCAVAYFYLRSKQGGLRAPREAIDDDEVVRPVVSRAAIPIQPVHEAEERPEFFSTGRDQAKFFRDMQRYAEQEGAPAPFVRFTAFWPTYDSMKIEQRAWYFYWRSQVRRGNYLPTDLSYIFILIYELLSGIGWDTAQQGYERLMAIWAAYRAQFPKMDKYMTAWTFDFALLHGCAYGFLLGGNAVRLQRKTMTDILVARHADDVPLYLPLALIGALAGYSPSDGKFYNDGNQRLMEEAIPRVITKVDEMLRRDRGIGLLEAFGPEAEQENVYEYRVLRGAVCPNADQKISFKALPYSTDEKLRTCMEALVKCSENTLREMKGWNSRLRGVALDEETESLVKSFLREEYGFRPVVKKPPVSIPAPLPERDSEPEQVPAPKPVREPKREPIGGAGFSLDLSGIEALRGQSEEVREALRVEQIPQQVKKDPLADLREITAIYRSLSNGARGFLGRLGLLAWRCKHVRGDGVWVAEINRLARLHLGRDLLVDEDSMVIAEDDFHDELSYLLDNPPPHIEAAPGERLFDRSLLSPEMRELLEYLQPEQRKALYVLIRGEHVQEQLERIAEETASMPQILIDEINLAAVQTLGDILVDCMDQEPKILDEYEEELWQSIS